MKLLHNYKVGDKIKFESERLRYTVIGITPRYAVCIKPFNLKKTYLYTIVDFRYKMRGPDSFLFGLYNHKDPADLQKCLEDLDSGDCELSRKHSIKLDIETK